LHHPARPDDAGVAGSILVDPERIALWLQLQALSHAGFSVVHRWGPADGTQVQIPGEAHQHAVPTLVICLQGVARMRGRETLDLHAGEVLVIEPGCWHEHVSHKRGSTSFGMGFLAGRCDVLFIDAHQTLWGLVAEQPYRDLCDRLLDEDDRQRRCELVARCIAQVLCDQAKVVDWIDPEVLRMAAFLWNHLHQPINGADVIRAARLGRSKAHVLFKTVFGRGPKQELTASRLQIARHLLRRGFTVTAAAARCGFADRADLTRSYRRAFGHAPSAAAGA
jgi:AraC-like DNA-binding protein